MATEGRVALTRLVGTRARGIARSVVSELAVVAGLCLLAVTVRIWLALKMPTPWALIDELIYAELAKSLVEEGEFLVRGVGGFNYGALYPAAIAPAWLAGSMETTYALAKAINVVLMTSVAVPVYLWARKLVAPAFAVVTTALVLLLPSFVYTAELLTENLFFPAFVLACFAIARALERPSLLRQALALGAIAIASAVRIQGIALVLVLVTAIALNVVLAFRARRERFDVRRLARQFLAFRVSLATLALVALGYLALNVVRGQPLSSGLGGYATVVGVDYGLADAVRWIVYHFAELGLAVAVIPVSALIVLLGLALAGDSTSAAERAFVAVAVTATFWLVVQVAVFASRFSLRIEERNMFYVMPLLFLALAVWIGRGLPRPSRLTTFALLTPAALIVTLPFESLLNVAILSDTFAFIPLLRLSTYLPGGVGDVRIAVALGVLAAGLVFAAVPRPLARVVAPLGIAAFCAMSSYPVFRTIQAYAVPIRATVAGEEPDWIDEAIGQDAHAAFVFGGSSEIANEATLLWQT
ncbi:MAG: hypothetical protein M3M94_04460, partial [Actinomycetota bacterium]|nr:hypothetical protein [Actinomycetota bacterium]